MSKKFQIFIFFPFPIKCRNFLNVQITYKLNSPASESTPPLWLVSWYRNPKGGACAHMPLFSHSGSPDPRNLYPLRSRIPRRVHFLRVQSFFNVPSGQRASRSNPILQWTIRVWSEGGLVGGPGLSASVTRCFLPLGRVFCACVEHICFCVFF